MLCIGGSYTCPKELISSQDIKQFVEAKMTYTKKVFNDFQIFKRAIFGATEIDTQNSLCQSKKKRGRKKSAVRKSVKASRIVPSNKELVSEETCSSPFTISSLLGTMPATSQKCEVAGIVPSNKELVNEDKQDDTEDLWNHGEIASEGVQIHKKKDYMNDYSNFLTQSGKDLEIFEDDYSTYVAHSEQLIRSMIAFQKYAHLECKILTKEYRDQILNVIISYDRPNEFVQIYRDLDSKFATARNLRFRELHCKELHSAHGRSLSDE
jgi:hypothetical protein